MEVGSYSICLLVTGLFHLAYCPQGSSLLEQMSESPLLRL